MSEAAVLKGKGVWARPRSDGTSELERAIDIAQQVNGSHVLYKVADGADYLDHSAQAAQRIRAAGLTPLAWMWLKLDDPAGEANAVVQAFADGYDGMVLDVEAPCSRKFDQARVLVQAVQAAGLDLDLIYNCSFPNISHHRDLPYDELNDICQGGLMPMAYGAFFAPGNPTPWEVQAHQVIDEWTYGHYETWCGLWGFRPPLYPVLGPYHDEYGSVRMSPAEFQVWLDRLENFEPTFVSIFTAAVVNDDLLPLIRDFVLAEEIIWEPPVPETVWAHRIEGVVLFEQPTTYARRVRAATYRSALGGLARQAGSGGTTWLQVRMPDSQRGWAPENRFSLVDPGPPPSLPAPPHPPPGHLTHVWTEQEVNFRSNPVVTDRTLIGRLYAGARMRVVEDPATAWAKLGVMGQWLNVQLDPDGPEGWIAAWYVTDHPPEHEEPSPLDFVRVDSAEGLNVRSGPGAEHPKTWHVPDQAVLDVIEDPREAASKVGVEGEWVQVRTPSLHEGHVAAWLLDADVSHDDRVPVNDAVLPFGECAWLLGIHAVGVNESRDFRHLFHGSGKTGWAIFTEAIGHNPNGLAPDEHRRQKLWDWARNGYGVVIRLNNGYEPNGTLPLSTFYDDFAATCARYAELYLHRPEEAPHRYSWVIVIGNEQNNVREHPGGAGNPIEHITPQLYAQAFNKAYQAIKNVLPNARVVPGAVDPYNTFPWARLGGLRYRPMDYYREMLAAIDNLDGLALHTYTHGPVVSYITHKKVFQDSPLDPGTEHEHYYDFQAYRPFAEAIPAQWRDRPIYITETNHWVVNPDGSPPAGWVNQNIGWVRAAYEEINRWNNTPHNQQIRCLLLYRWQDDEWQIETRDQVQADFRQALANDYRWRR
ncbi:MAG: SH3 domain-containing protein [Anaerolineae bacterium]|nr:SH3 domain-containing protein [Anaerolineae bacterium]